MKINDLNGLLEEISQTANGPEIDQAEKELKNEATVEKEGETKAPTADNAEVYGDDDKTEEDVKEINITEGMTDFEILQELDRCGFEPSLDNLAIIKEELSQTANGPEIGQAEGELKNEATEEGEGETKAPTADNAEVYGDGDKTEEDVKEVTVTEGCSEKAKKALKEEDLTEPNPEVDVETADQPVDPAPQGETAGEETPVEDAIEKEVSDAITNPVDTDSIPEESIDTQIASLTERLKSLTEELSQLANGPEIDQAQTELKNEATEEGEGETKAPTADNAEVYAGDDKTTEEVKEVIIKEEADEDEKSDSEDKKDEDEDKSDDDKKEDDKKDEESDDKEDSKDEDKKDEDEDKSDDKKDEDKEAINEELEQVANGPEIDQAQTELKNEATVEKEPTTAAPTETNSDVYCDCTHKQVEDVVEVVIEAANLCKANNVPLTIAEISKNVRALLESDSVQIANGPEIDQPQKELKNEATEEGEGETKAPTADNAEVYAGDDKTEEDVKEVAVTETVKYTSIKEACMLDEGYFNNDSYTRQTAQDKQQKLLEQFALLIARENNGLFHLGM